MELNAEINRVFGQEMAKLFAAEISEQELKDHARNAWRGLIETRGWQGKEIDGHIRNQIVANMKDVVTEITETDEFKEQMEDLAKTIVQEVIDETHKKMVDSISSQLATLSTGYGGLGLRGYIEDCVVGMMNR